MVSLKALGGSESPPTIAKLSQFLKIPSTEVDILLKEGRLDGVILSILRRKGTALTPSVKNAVQQYVRRIEPNSSDSSLELSTCQPPELNGTATIMT